LSTDAERELKQREVKRTQELLEQYRKKEFPGLRGAEDKQIIIKALVCRLVEVQKELDAIVTQ